MPIDVEPTGDGNVVMDREKVSRERALGAIASLGEEHKPDDVAPFVRVLKKGEEIPEEARYVSHFATCPLARSHRRSA